MSVAEAPPTSGAEPAADETPPPRRGFDWKKAALLALVVGAIAAFFLLGGGRLLTIDAIKAHRDALLAFKERHAVVLALASVGVYVAATALGLPDAIVLSLAIGFLFGPWVGTLIVVPSATAGATLAFLGARYLFADAARRRMGPRMRRVADGFDENGFSYMLSLRLVPIFPFVLVNVAPAFTSLKTRTFVAATAIGIVPGSFVYCYLGDSLASLDEEHRTELFVALALLAALSLLPVFWKKLRYRRNPGGAA